MEQQNEVSEEDIYLNAFPLFVKPDYARDAENSKYLENYTDYLASDLARQLPGVDPHYLSSLQISFQSTLEICRACERKSLDEVVKNTRDALNNLSQGNFFVLHFAHHSCDIVVFPSDEPDGPLLFVPIELRRTTFSTAYPIEEEGFTRAWRIVLPKAIFSVAKGSITNDWLKRMANFHIGSAETFPGAFPCGSGSRASNLPDNRKSPTPTYIIEWLLPELSKTTIQVDESIIATKTISSLRNFVGQGVPWRRSVHWNSIRFAAALSQRWYDFPLEQYKVVQLGFKTWLASKYHRTMSIGAVVARKLMEMLQRISFRARKLVALNSASGAVIAFVLIQCADIQRSVDNFHPAILQKKAIESNLPKNIEMEKVSRRFMLSDAVLQSLKEGANVGLSFLKEDISSQVSPAEFINLMNANSALQLVSDTAEELKQTRLAINKQKPDLADFTARSTLHGTENFVYCLFNNLHQVHIDESNAENWAINLRRLTEEYTLLIPTARRPTPERKSREVLAVWCLVALIDHVARKQWPHLFKKVGLVLPIELLEGLTFRERPLMETAARLIAHKRSFGNAAGLFDYKGPDVTLQFAVDYFDSGDGAEMKESLKEEREQQVVREEEREKQLKNAEQQYTTLSMQRCGCYYSRYNRLQCNRCSSMDSLLYTSALVKHPLPNLDRDREAKQVIFFTAQPACFRSFAAITLKAYTIHDSKIQQLQSHTNCVSWSKGAGLKLMQYADTPALLLSSRKPLATDSHFKKLASFTVDIVYPDFATSVGYSNNGSFSSFASFEYQISQYQYQLGGALKNLPWMADASHTENSVLAEQISMPHDMMKNEFIAFGRVRAAPNMQVRELFMAMQTMSDKQLNSDDMLTLVQRVLYEMGPTHDSAPSVWYWKVDLFSESWLTSLRESLTDKSKKIRQNWESHPIMRLIIDTATFALQFGQREAFEEVLNGACQTVREWINELNALIEEFIDKPEEVMRWRLLQVRFYSYLLLGSHEMTETSLEYRSELSKLTNICGSNITPDIYSLLSSVDSHIFNNTTQIHELVQSDTSILIKLLLKIGIEPMDVDSWERVSQNGKFIDWYSSGHYMINPISGLILCDGLTVSELPSAIVQTPIYQEVMTNANFIVQRVKNEYISAPFGNRKFKFGLWEYNQRKLPFVQEQYEDGRELTLLPRAFLMDSNLPSELIEDRAHWVDFKNQIIEFRAKDFRQLEAAYWMKLDTGECFMNDVFKRQLLDANDVHLEGLIKLLTCIDTVNNLICFTSSPKEFKVLYLNLNLTFTVQENGEIASDNYPGYKLASTQLVPTLPRFSRYLYIEPQSSVSTKLPLVLIPNKSQIYPYELDEVHQRLIPSTTLARLILARIYIEYSSAIDPLTKTTGVQHAFAILSQCWQNIPYSSAEFSELRTITSYMEDSAVEYSIKLLVYHLDRVSRTVEFLHPGKATTVPKEWSDEIATITKRYFKTKHTLPVSCVLDADIEEYFLTQFPPTKKHECNGQYFARVPTIVFSKETVPAYFNMLRLFGEGTRVSALMGSMPSEWAKVASTNEQLFFWFLKKQRDTALPQLLTRLTFLMHQSLLKGSTGLEFLQCLYCILTTPGVPAPDYQLLNSEYVYKANTLSSSDIGSMTPRDVSHKTDTELWNIYSKYYLDANLSPKAQFYDNGYFNGYDFDGKESFLSQLQTLHDQCYIGTLFNNYTSQLKEHQAFNCSRVDLTEIEVYERHDPLVHEWPSVDAPSHLMLEDLNGNSNALQFFETELATFYRASHAESANMVDIKALKTRETEIEERLEVIKRDRTKLEERKILTDELYEIQDIINANEDAAPAIEFPLKNQVVEGSKDLQSRIVNELKDSYRKHVLSQQPAPEIDTDSMKYISLKAKVDEKRRGIWDEIVRILTGVDDPLLKIWQMSDLFALPHQRLIPSLLKREAGQFQLVNPCVSDGAGLYELALHFAILHVHSNKLARIIELMDDLQNSEPSDHDGFKSQLYAELSDKREWNPTKNPGWLIFEMERRVNIRSIQVEIATKMLNEKNIVLQLNMGEGKSKVIVPILCSILADGKTLVRVNVLSSLFHEVHSYLKQALGNMLGKRIYAFPFRRNVTLSTRAMTALRDQFEECKMHGGIILSTPEHRLSLQLKYREVLWQYGHQTNGLTAVDFKGIIDIPILELLDESDEILRHKYQLIYTLGDQQPIEGSSSRWNVHLALIRCIFLANLYQDNREAVPASYLENDGSARLAKLYHKMRDSKAHFIFHSSRKEPHVLPVVRLINEEFFNELREDLFEVFQLDPVWRDLIALNKTDNEMKQLKDFIMNTYPNTPDGDAQCEKFKNELVRDKSLKVPVLVLRGLLSFEILKTSLTRRHRIHYGIDTSRKVPMAVPFRGKDTPAEGVEFGQPDMAITLTILAHSSEISAAAVKRCFTYLKTKGVSEQQTIYRVWYAISKPIMHEKFVKVLENIEAVNVENVNMMQHLALYFGRNYEVIAYYLGNFVLPDGTRSFPEKIVANSWDLAKSSEKVVGFSGTDDTKHTLPLYVRQYALPSVETTNGKMVDVLTSEKFNNRLYMSLPKEFESDRILQEMCSPDNWNVLIDSGALIEGMSNREVVERVLKICPRFQTGIFFDDTNRLALIDTHGNSAHLNSSRPLELSCFTYLDDIHTRGTDLPFPTKSHAFVTVATGITKDKLMQACMRMRKLVHGLHKVTFWGTSEVTMKIQQLDHNNQLAEDQITSTHILEWVVENTIKAQEEAIITYASQGFHHYAASMGLKLFQENENITPPDIIKAVVLKELLETEAMYGIPLKSILMKDHINAHGTSTKSNLLGREIKDQSYQLAERASPLYETLIDHAKQLVPAGKRVRVCGSVNEEYERELQQEVEEERHRELPPRASPIVEESWAFDQVLNHEFGQSLTENILVPKVLSLKQLFNATILHEDWSENRAFARNDVLGNIYLTKNFISTVKCEALSDYIRPLDVVLKFNGDTTKYLLVSLFEANELVTLIEPNDHVEFCHLRYMHGTSNDEHRCITLLKLLNGNLSYKNQEKTALLMLLSLVPEKIDFIDQTITGMELSSDKWHETRKALARSGVLDKHNGFAEERDDVQLPAQGSDNVSLVRFITSVLNQTRLFSSKPAKFINGLLALRDTIRDYNYSPLHSLLGDI